MLLATIVDTSRLVAATRSKKAKTEVLARTLAAGWHEHRDPALIALAASYLSGRLTQRRTGIGWRSVSQLPTPASVTSLTITEVDHAIERLSALNGPGSQSERALSLAALLQRATETEQEWLRSVLTGEVRQGALEALVQEAVAAATQVPAEAVRRAAMLTGSTPAVAALAFEGGATALAATRLEVLRPVQPMLASPASGVEEAVAELSAAHPDTGDQVAVESKLDGIRVQVHRLGDEVLIASRSLDDLTARLPEVVALARSLPSTQFVLDGEALILGPDGRPRPFQETSARTSSGTDQQPLSAYFFDLLHHDGHDLIDSPAAERFARLDALVPAAHRVRRLITNDATAAARFADQVLADGHEGVVVKSLSAPYAAGRRGAAWRKVKPVRTLDLVVLAVEQGSGRRSGWLSNIHLGARDPQPDGTDRFVMLGKTFKGMTDEMLAWQTERFLALATHRDQYVVHVRPEQVVEIAFDGVQRSTRYPGGAALRFARVLRYRDDKSAGEADTIDTVRGWLPGNT